ncbi:hypothetical protein M409DRAFT_30298 [Zasmidium cellare ATCC 36951]|uniref:RING-type domain-containing protein n=1 Tax=Zasmidium cellare ATCC 36951 TaxID=1080233 RepID=A0A6A6BWV4_ZASCE|nr:uncharacterized protein M409DRAFT_30298 [Zasmidium cellare ATCC 36951]KAF2159291.1 hypothetical protein M409DRAFT_30298 [Zasmidium cellare ATCC 36951]
MSKKCVFNMLVLQPIQIQTNLAPSETSHSLLYQTDSTEPFYHRTPPPSLEELQFFGLKAGDKSKCQDQLCAVCFGPFQNPVVTRCQHTFCFGCIYEWFGGSTACPKCTGDLYQPRKLRQQPSREIHPAERPGPVEDSQWKLPSPTTVTTVKATFKAHIKKPSTEQKLLVKKARSSGHLQIPQPSHQHSYSDRSSSATQQQRNKSFTSSLRKGHARGGSRHSSLPSYMKRTNPPPQPTHNLDYTYQEPIIVHSPQDADAPPNDPIDLDASVVELYSTCTKYLERTQQAAAPTTEQSVHLVHVNSEEILADMWMVSKASGQDAYLSIRCKAIAKCVWREWEEYLRRMEGSLLMGQELWWGLHRNFERTVVEYGWVEDWMELPGEFVELLERVMAVAGQR